MNNHAEKTFLDGSLISWVQVAGGFFLFFNSWGLINSFGVFQSYYEDVLLTHYSSSAISWIGTIQGFLLLVGGLIVGPVLDKGHLRIILCLGSFLVVFGLMMTSLATEYYQFFLAQGVTGGLGSALLFLPSVAVVATYFERRRAVAIGIVASGGSIGSVLYPIIFHRLIGPLGFGWTTRVIAFIALGTSAFSAAVMKVRVSGPNKSRPFFDRSALTEPAFVMAGLGLFLASMGLYIPIFYLPTYFAHYLHASSSLSFYSLSILNAASMFGRIMPGLLADRIGPIYAIIPVTAATVILAFAWIGIRNIGGMIAFACLYGFSSGAILSLPPSIVAAMSPDLALVGTRMGMCFAFSSFGILIGSPVASTLLNLEDNIWWRMQLFTGAILAGGLLCFIAVMFIQLRDRKK